MRGITVAAALCLAAACGTDPAVAPPSEPATPAGDGGPAFALASCVETGPSGWVRPILQCGQKVKVMSTVPAIDAKIDGAIYIWNSVVLKDGLPEFTTDVGSRTVEIAWGNTFNLTASPYYCGDTYPSLTYIVIHRSGAKQDCGLTSTGGGVRFTNAVPLSGLSALIAHELSHAIGFKHLSQSGPQFNSAADHCVASLPASGGANGSLCQAEIELLRYNFGLRGTAAPDPTKHFATGFEVATSGLPSPITVGQSGTLTVSVVQFGRGAPPSSFTPPAANTLSYSWTSDNLAVATVGTSTGSSNPVNAKGRGTTTIHIRLTSAAYEQAVPFGGGDITVTVIAKPPKPTSLAASGVTHSSATIRWVNGATDAGTTTTLEYRQSGAASWSTVSGILAGVATRVITGLTPLKKYDVRAFHVRDGLNSDITTAAGLFTTTAVPPPPPITNFQVTNCERRPVGTKTFGYYAMAWTSAAAAAGYTLQIGEGTTSSSAGAAVILTLGSSARNAEVGGYLVTGPTPTYRWFWIRYVGNGITGAWTALVGNPLAVNTCLQM